MARIALGLALTAALASAGCSSVPKPPPAVERPAPPAPDPEICAALEAEPDVAGGIVQPATPAQRAAVARFLDAEVDVRGWGRRGWSRAARARLALCPYLPADAPKPP